jgi:TetR/AcrR family transcriptional regulator, cholesterol catabolism regulator
MALDELIDARADALIDAVVDILVSDGYEAVQVRTVARRARTSLRTIYEHFAGRDELIVAAMERWMASNAYAHVRMPEAGESPDETLGRVTRTVFEPWERYPDMLRAFYWARRTPGGGRLEHQGLTVIQPVSAAVFAGLDPDYVADVETTMLLVRDAAIERFVAGEIAVTDIVPLLLRTLRRLMSDNASYWTTRHAEATGRANV